MPRTAFFSVLALAVIAALAFGYMSGKPATPPQLQWTFLMPDPEAVTAEFALTDHDHHPFTNASLKGKWSFLFWGYTRCPDVCPTTLSFFGQLIQAMEEQGMNMDQVQFRYISVDPERDTLEKLKLYTTYFNPRIVGVTGDAGVIERMTRPIGVFYRRTANPFSSNQDDYLIDHSTSIILAAPNGQMYAALPAPHAVDWVLSEFQAVRSYYEATH